MSGPASLRRIEPLRDIGGRLLDVEKPARYLGGEYGSIAKEGAGLFTVALCFPDLYEIGMSNNAVRILYNGLNALAGLRCERVFAPAPDFEKLLADLDLPLYTLETGIPLRDTDLLGFSIGYELSATNILAVLSAGGIPLLAAERGEGAPLVIAGGPAITNPHPFADFLDAAYIGEAEASFFALAADLARLKSGGARRSDLLERLSSEPAIWMPARGGSSGKRATRAIFGGFCAEPYHTALPLPTVKAVQDHGTVEIMRGCPNGCRFCHAGFFYRPQRVKPISAIRDEVDCLVREGGYREITLASLSSGDYPGLPGLIASLNTQWASKRVSFQLPSLKVNSFTLPLISQLAEVRKSGLTFAVETPVDAWQFIVNKEVSFERTLAILEEARAQGFKQAKFYFMIGLPVPGSGLAEVEAIVDYFDRLFSRIRMQINVNVGTFVPKPHTPFQWCAQLNEEASLAAINALRAGLRPYRNVKLSYHSPFVSQLEGILARGDERVGGLILEAFRRGARLDAWDERFDRELWRSVIDGAGWNVVAQYCGARGVDEPLPWDDVSVRVAKSYFAKEHEKALRGELTDGCINNCNHPCGSCSSEGEIVLNSEQVQVSDSATEAVGTPSPVIERIVFSFRKDDVALFYQHLSIIDAFERAFLMTGIEVAYSEGFNPMARFEMAQPLPIAIGSDGEIASLLMTRHIEPAEFMKLVNAHLPRGLEITEARVYPVEAGVKQRSIGSLSWGSVFRVGYRDAVLNDAERPQLATRIAEALPPLGLSRDLIVSSDDSLVITLPDPSKKEASLVRILESCTEARPVQSVFAISRQACLADSGSGPESFFDAYARVAVGRVKKDDQ